MSPQLFTRSFAGGELAPSLAARADQAKYQTGLRTCRNFIVQRHGGVANRAGFRFVGESRDNNTATFLLRYVAADPTASVLIEAGAFYLRFYFGGALVRLSGVAGFFFGNDYKAGDIVNDGDINFYCLKNNSGFPTSNPAYWYEMPADILQLPTPFGNAGFSWTQSGNVITMTSPLAPPYELIYLGPTQWVIRQVNTAPAITPPDGLVATAPAGPAGPLNFQYVATAAAPETYEESTACPIGQLLGTHEGTPEAPISILITPPANGDAVVEYYVYKDPNGNGTFGFIGTATGVNTFKDTGFIPDYNNTPPLVRVLFASANNFPAFAAYYQQRRFFANTILEPDGIWGSRVGLYSNFSISSPLQDDDALTFRIAGNQHNPVQHLAGLKTLVVLTAAGVWTVSGGSTKLLAPNSVDAEQEAYLGSSDVRPVGIANALLYVQARGAIVRDLQFYLPGTTLAGSDLSVAGKDLTIFAAHLFDGFTIERLDFQQTPHSILWAVRSDGVLLGLTYIPEQDVWGWHRHDTAAGGIIEDVCIVPEPGEDTVYVLVRRTIGGVFKRYIERLERRTILNFAADSFFVDAGLTYTGPPTVTTIAGLDHLNGEIVAVVCDGVVIFDGDPTAAVAETFRVNAGTIAAVLPASTIVHAGLPIRFAEIETLDLDVSGSAVRGQKRRVGSLSLLLEQSVRTFRAGPDTAHLLKFQVDPFQAGQAGVPTTSQEEITITASYNDYGRIVIRQTDPLPLTILGILPNIEVGG